MSDVTNRGHWLLSVNPELSEWKCYPFGSPDFAIIPQKGSVPNWFWRKMQYLIFGFKWVKNPEEKKQMNDDDNEEEIYRDFSAFADANNSNMDYDSYCQYRDGYIKGYKKGSQERDASK